MGTSGNKMWNLWNFIFVAVLICLCQVRHVSTPCRLRSAKHDGGHSFDSERQYSDFNEKLLNTNTMFLQDQHMLAAFLFGLLNMFFKFWSSPKEMDESDKTWNKYVPVFMVMQLAVFFILVLLFVEEIRKTDPSKSIMFKMRKNSMHLLEVLKKSDSPVERMRFEKQSFGRMEFIDELYMKDTEQLFGKGGEFVHGYGKPDVDYLLEFRRDQSFKQTCMACPASVSLVGHYSSGTYGHPASGLELHKEGVRVASFKNFPTTILVSALRMAQAGFYYTGERDIVKCFSCGVTYQGWHIGDRPSLVHARIAPNCPLVRGSDSDNLPLPLTVTSRPVFSEAESLSLDSAYGSRSYDSSTGAVSIGTSNGGRLSSSNDELQPDSAPDAVPDSMSAQSSRPQPLAGTASYVVGTAQIASKPVPSSLATPENSMFSGAPLFGRATPMDGGAPRNQPMPAKRLDLGGAVYPLYSQMDARKRSYSNWAADQNLPSVDELLTLGFFYAGYADCVRCFFCGIGLKSWEPGDVPAEVHARWRPTCEYLRLVKGDEFVDRVANGGRNVASNGGQSGNLSIQGNTQQTSETTIGTVQTSQGNSSTSNGTNTQPTQVPDIPIVRRARETGYTDQQIADAIDRLHNIGMERAIDVMLVEVLANLNRDNPPQPLRRQSNSPPNQPNNRQESGSNDSTLPSQRSDALHRDDALTETDSAPAVGELTQHHSMLQEENTRLRSMRTCQRCRVNPVGVIFLPCGHIVSCTECAPSIRRCLRCDTVIRATANVFFS